MNSTPIPPNESQRTAAVTPQSEDRPDMTQASARWKLLLASILAALLLLGFWVHSSAAQRFGPQMEYLVVPFIHAGDYRSDGDGSRNAAKFTEQLNTLGADGWEYVGLVCNPSSYSRGFVAFKRQKR